MNLIVLFDHPTELLSVYDKILHTKNMYKVDICKIKYSPAIENYQNQL